MSHIARLTTTDGHLRDVDINFSPRLNCIIGARGTCKSTVVETIRFLFDDDRERVEVLLAEKSDPDASTPAGLIRATLRGGTAQLVLSEQANALSDRITLERDTGSSSPRIYLDGVKAVDQTEFLSNIEIYSQGELQEIAVSPAKRLNLIDRPHKSQIHGLRGRASELAGQIAEAGPQIRELRSAIESSQVVVREGAALRRRLAEQRQQRPTMSPQIAEQREQHQHREEVFAEAERATARHVQGMEFLRDAVRHFEVAASSIADKGGADVHLTPLTNLRQSISSAAVAARTLLTDLEAFGDLDVLLTQTRHDFDVASTAYFEALKSEQAATAAIKAEDNLASEVSKLERVEHELVDLEAALEAAEADRRAWRLELRDLNSEVYRMRLAQVDQINAEFSNDIVLSLNQGAHTESYRKSLDELLQGSRLRERDAICAQIAAVVPPADLVSFVDSDDAERIAAILNRDIGQMTRLVSHLSETAGLYHLESEAGDDELQITMFVDGVPTPVGEMSKGQKATAILPLLLRPAPYPLILDQPEDDLDNRFIYDTLVKRIVHLKLDRQLIFVTHNANIPVIGDAEAVFLMTMAGHDHARLRGPETVDGMRDEILRLLEGGREAFDLRSATYGPAQPPDS